jgi:hypothetical protein
MEKIFPLIEESIQDKSNITWQFCIVNKTIVYVLDNISNTHFNKGSVKQKYNSNSNNDDNEKT